MTIKDFILKVDTMRFYQKSFDEHMTKQLYRRTRIKEKELDEWLGYLMKKINETQHDEVWNVELS